MKKALITGISGHDGSYLAALLLEKGCEAELVFDTSKPDGTPRKLMDSSRLYDLGWSNARSLRDGIEDTYNHWLGTDQRSTS